MSITKSKSLIVTSLIVDATSELINDGSIELKISGGTPPYKIKWDIGKTTEKISNLYPKNYKVTITDRYGDNTYNETYTIKSLLTPTPTPSITPTPPPTPTPSNLPDGLCLGNDKINYVFIHNTTKTKNGYSVWNNNENNLEVFYNQKFQRWEIDGWSEFKRGKLINKTKSSFPVGSWKVLGDDTPVVTWKMVKGSCSELPLSFNVSTNDETCYGKEDGTAKINAINGLEPYYYRIQGVSPYPDFSTDNIFTNLLPGLYNAEVSAGTENTIGTFKIYEGREAVTYNLYLNSKLTVNSIKEKSMTFAVGVKPELPVGYNINFNLKFIHTKKYRDNGTQKSYYKMKYDLNGVSDTFDNIILTNSTSTKVCDSVTEYTEIYEHSKNLNITGRRLLKGTYVYGIEIKQEGVTCDCPMTVYYGLEGIIDNAQITVSNGCSSLSTTNNFKTSISLKDCK